MHPSRLPVIPLDRPWAALFATRRVRLAKSLALGLGLSAAGISPESAQAASQTWKAVATDGNWTTATNWVGGGVPGITRTANANTTDVVTFNAVSNFSTITIDANRFVNSIAFTAGAGAYTFTGGLLYLSQGGSISMAAGVTNAQVFSNTLQPQTASSTNGTLSFINNATSTAATLTFNASTFTLTNGNGRPTTLTLDGSNTGENVISSNITDAFAAQAVNVINKNGIGTWVLSGSNTFTNSAGGGPRNVANGIQINAGTLVAANNNALGNNATANLEQVSINSGGSLQLRGGITHDNGVSLNLNNGGTITSNGTNATNGRINVGTAAATSVTLSTLNAADVFTIGNGSNDFTGGAADTVVHITGPGTVVNAQSSTGYIGTISIDAGALRNGSSTNGLGVNGIVTFGSGSTGKLQLGNNLGLTSLTTNNATPTAGVVETGVAGTQTLTLTNASANTFGGTLRNGTGTLVITKTGAGTLTLSGNSNTYTGATAISAGVLNVTNTSGSATGTGAVALGTATLTGAGNINGTVTAVSTSIITPGTVTAGNAGAGALTIGNLTLVSGTTFNYGLVSTGNTPNSNNYLSTGALTLPGSGVVLNLYTPGTSNPFAAAGVYNLFQYTSLPGVALTNSTFSFGTSIAGYNASFATSGGFLQLILAQAGALATWTNGGATGDWSLAANWSGTGTLPPQAAGDSATFGATAPGTVNLDTNETVGGLTFNNASAFTLSSSNSSILTLDNTGSGVTVTTTTGTHAILNAVALNDNVTVATASGTQLTISGDISEVSSFKSLLKNGLGTLILSGNNTYSGGTVVSGGVLQFNSLAALGTGTTLGLGAAATNGTLQYAGGNTADVSSLAVTLNAGGGTIDTNGNNVTYANPIGGGGSGGLTKTGAGTLTLSGANTYTGTTTINNGTLTVGSNANLGAAATGAAAVFNGGTLATTTSFGLFNGAQGTNDRPITLTGAGTLAPATGTTLTVSGAITGGGQLIKSDAGQLTVTTPVSGQNTFSGGTLASAGTILLGDLAAAGNGLGSGAITFTGGTVSTRFQGNTIPGTQSGDLANALVVNAGQTGTLILAGRQNVSGTLAGSGTLNLQLDYIRDSYNGNWSGFTGQLNFLSNTNGGDLRINTTTGFGTAKLNLGAGTNLAVLLNFNPSLTLSAGEISGAATSFLGGGTVGGRTLTWSVGGANTNAQFDGTIRDGGVSGAGTGPTAITKVGTGTWTLTGTNTYTGTTTISGGALQIGNGGTTGTLGTAAVTNNASLVFNRSDAISIGNAITGSGSLVQLGTGQTTLSATNSVASLITRFGEAVITGSTTATNFASVGSISGDSAILTVQTGGSLTATAGAGDLNVGDNHGSTGVVNLTGGSISVTNLSLGKNFDNVAATTTTGTVNQSGSSTFTVGGGNGVILANNTGGVGTYNLNGGTLIAKQVSQGAGASGTFNFNGGTLQAGGANATFLTGLTAANVQAGGANINDGGFAVTIGQSLNHDAALGGTADGGLTKSGAGTLTLTGASTYTGVTTVSNGSLKLDNNNTTTARLATTSGVTVNATGTLLLAQSEGTASNDRINDGATLSLAGGTFGFDTGVSNSSETLGTLTLSLSSTLDFGIGSGNTLTFSGLSLGSNTLTVYNWSGTRYATDATTDTGGASQDRLLFTSDVSGQTLSQINFYSGGAGSSWLGNGNQISFDNNPTFEVVPVPEPTTIFGALALVGLVGYRERRRLAELCGR